MDIDLLISQINQSFRPYPPLSAETYLGAIARTAFRGFRFVAEAKQETLWRKPLVPEGVASLESSVWPE